MVSQLSKNLGKTDIIYPESDGKPIADNTKKFELIAEIEKSLDLLYINDPQVSIACDLFWYPIEGQPKIVTAPDVMVVLVVPKSIEANTNNGKKTTSRLKSYLKSSHPPMAQSFTHTLK